jgi:hypothetical protein|tara:strand:+ start:43 stop:246 length:204 start_codon:yes stop_codon:yes gene_type:complete
MFISTITGEVEMSDDVFGVRKALDNYHEVNELDPTDPSYMPQLQRAAEKLSDALSSVADYWDEVRDD